MKFSELEALLCRANEEHREMTGYVTFTPDSFDKEYTWESRTYLFSSDNKRWQSGKISNSVWASNLDGTDQGVKLSGYMFGKDAWDIEDCGVVNYQVLEICERELTCVGVFPTETDAKSALRKALAQAVGLENEEKLKAWLGEHAEKAELSKNGYTGWANYVGPNDGDYDVSILALLQNGETSKCVAL